MSARGIWESENIGSKLDLTVLIDFIESKWFNCFVAANTSPNDKEKLILFTLLVARAYSEGTSVNLSKDKTHSAWRDLLVNTSDFLTSNSIISDVGVHEMFESSDGTYLRPLMKFFRYSEYLPKKTGGTFIAKSLKYYLDLYKNTCIDSNSLTHLFGLVLKGHISYELTSKVADLCRTLAYDVSARVYEPGETSFASFEYDSIIENSLRDLALTD